METSDLTTDKKNETAKFPRKSNSELSPSEADDVIQRAAEVARRNAAQVPEKRMSGSLKPAMEDAKAALASAKQAEAAERAAEQMKRGRLLEQCGVPARYRAIDLNDLSEVPEECRAKYATVVRQVREHVLRSGSIVALLGMRGPGKTAIGCGLVLEFCNAGKKGVYLDAMDYFIRLKKTYDGGNKDESQVEADYVRPALLVIDSIEERGDTPWEDRMLTRLVNKRYGEKRSTILISNQTPKDFNARVGLSIADRINDRGLVIQCTWKSLRGRI